MIQNIKEEQASSENVTYMQVLLCFCVGTLKSFLITVSIFFIVNMLYEFILNNYTTAFSLLNLFKPAIVLTLLFLSVPLPFLSAALFQNDIKRQSFDIVKWITVLMAISCISIFCFIKAVSEYSYFSPGFFSSSALLGLFCYIPLTGVLMLREAQKLVNYTPPIIDEVDHVGKEIKEEQKLLPNVTYLQVLSCFCNGMLKSILITTAIFFIYNLKQFGEYGSNLNIIEIIAILFYYPAFLFIVLTFLSAPICVVSALVLRGQINRRTFGAAIWFVTIMIIGGAFIIAYVTFGYPLMETMYEVYNFSSSFWMNCGFVLWVSYIPLLAFKMLREAERIVNYTPPVVDLLSADGIGWGIRPAHQISGGKLLRSWFKHSIGLLFFIFLVSGFFAIVSFAVYEATSGSVNIFRASKMVALLFPFSCMVILPYAFIHMTVWTLIKCFWIRDKWKKRTYLMSVYISGFLIFLGLVHWIMTNNIYAVRH